MTSVSTVTGAGLVGLGLLGSAMGRRLLASGVRVLGYDINPAAREQFERAGGETTDSLEGFRDFSDPILLCLPNSTISRAVLEELLEWNPAHVIVDTTTGSPDEMRENARIAASYGIAYLDACVGGASVQMEQGEAILMVGGASDAVARGRPLLDMLSPKVFVFEEPGDGAKMKLVTNLVLGLNRAALAEGFAFAESLGFDREQTREILHAGPADSQALRIKGEKLVSEEFSAQAKLAQHHKDVQLILAEASRKGVTLPLSELHDRMLARCEESGWSELDNSAILLAYLNRKLDHL